MAAALHLEFADMGDHRWPADRVERRPLAALIRYERNARTHPPAQIAAIARAIQEFGWTAPILIDPKNHILGGHGRALAAAQLGLADVPVMVAEGWTQAQIKAYRVWENQSALQAGWNLGLLRDEILELQGLGFDASLTGFDETAIADILARGLPDPVADPDALPDPPKAPTSRPGDRWRLGRHTLVCDDCCAVLPALRPPYGALVTDPPYGIGFAYDVYDDTPSDNYGQWLWDIVRRAEALLAPGAPCFVWQASDQVRDFAARFPRPWRLFIAAKNFVQMRPSLPMQFAYDTVLAWWVDGAKPWTLHTENRDFHVADTAPVFGQSNPRIARHPCPRPVDQLQHMLNQWVRPGETVLDPFAGTGSLIIAAEAVGRAAFGIELSPAYVDVALERFLTQTAIEPVLEATGQSLTEVRRARPGP